MYSVQHWPPLTTITISWELPIFFFLSKQLVRVTHFYIISVQCKTLPLPYCHLLLFLVMFDCLRGRNWRLVWTNQNLFLKLGLKKNEIMPFAATWMDPEIIILSEISQRETDTIWYHLYVESKIWHRWTYLQNRNRLTDIEEKLMVTKGDRGGQRGGEINQEFGINRYTLLYIK